MSNERDIWVYTPARDQPAARPSALLVLFDGLANMQLLSVPVIMDNLIAAARIPATVAVFVSHPGGARMQELGDTKFTRCTISNSSVVTTTSWRGLLADGLIALLGKN